MIDGLAVVDKPAGMTSHDVVSRCRRIFAQKRVGHAGTLDPDATGVLLVGLGRATRLLQYVSGLSKSYTGEVVLGVATSTLDAAGEVTGRWDLSDVTLAQAREAAAGLTGAISQVPPMVSAVKVGGRRLHELARAGIVVERAARQVSVTRFDVESAPPGSGADLSGGPDDPPTGPVFSIAVDCSSGTYIRVLASDLGDALGGGAYLRNLRRTAVGPWTVGAAVPLDALDVGDVVPPVGVLPWLPTVSVDQSTEGEVRHGRVLEAAELGVTGDGPWTVIGPGGDLLAVYVGHGLGRVKPAVVMAGQGQPGR